MVSHPWTGSPISFTVKAQALKTPLRPWTVFAISSPTSLPFPICQLLWFPGRLGCCSILLAWSEFPNILKNNLFTSFRVLLNATFSLEDFSQPLFNANAAPINTHLTVVSYICCLIFSPFSPFSYHYLTCKIWVFIHLLMSHFGTYAPSGCYYISCHENSAWIVSQALKTKLIEWVVKNKPHYSIIKRINIQRINKFSDLKTLHNTKSSENWSTFYF